MATVILQTRVDNSIKQEAENLFASLGLDMTTAIRLFLKQSVNQQRLPFDIVPPQYNFSKETLATIDEKSNHDESFDNSICKNKCTEA